MCAYFLSYGYVTWSKLKVVWRALGLEIIICSRYNENRRHLHMLMDVKLKLVCAFLAFWRAKIRQRGICISNTSQKQNSMLRIRFTILFNQRYGETHLSWIDGGSISTFVWIKYVNRQIKSPCDPKCSLTKFFIDVVCLPAKYLDILTILLLLWVIGNW